MAGVTWPLCPHLGPHNGKGDAATLIFIPPFLGGASRRGMFARRMPGALPLYEVSYL